MNGQTHYGKGSKQRPTNQQAYADNWDRIFGKKDKKELAEQVYEDHQELFDKLEDED